MQDYKTKRVMNISETAYYAGVSRSTIESWLAEKLLPFENLPSRGNGTKRFRRIRKADIDTFLDSHYQADCQVIDRDVPGDSCTDGKTYNSGVTLLPRESNTRVRRVV